GFWLPTDALIKGHRGLWATYIVTPPDKDGEPHTAIYTDIELLYTQADRAFVRGILKDGQLVVAAGAERIAPGSPVIPTGYRFLRVSATHGGPTPHQPLQLHRHQVARRLRRARRVTRHRTR
ncbi:MAG: hypothetical protein ACYTGQ_08750, partial [Planctomycetota bacterium]